MGSANVAVDHYISWHTGDGVATDLLGERTPCLHCLVHHAVMLTVSTLGSAATLALAEVDDGVLGRLKGVDLNLVEDGVGHRVSPLDYLSSIGHPGGSRRGSVPPSQLVWKRPLLKLARLNASRFTNLKVPKELA